MRRGIIAVFLAANEGWCNDATGADEAALAYQPRLGRRECYGSIFPIVHPLTQRCESRLSPGAHRASKSHPALHSTGAAIMAKPDKLDPVWEDLDR
jgi:hypothetical protein